MAIIIVITITCTFMVNKMFLADKAKAETLALVEQNNQLASIGQLAAGVAHEINNPLALINETAGYIKDLFTITETYRQDDELMENINSILEAVERCGRITGQLLGFARKFDIKIQKNQYKGNYFRCADISYQRGGISKYQSKCGCIGMRISKLKVIAENYSRSC